MLAPSVNEYSKIKRKLLNLNARLTTLSFDLTAQLFFVHHYLH